MTRSKGPGAQDVRPEDLRSDPDRHLRLSPESRAVVRRLNRISSRSGRLSSLAYNVTISHERRFLWFRVAKVGTRTLLSHFDEHDVRLDVRHAMGVRYPTEVFGDYFKFALVREPVGRLVSAWQDKVVRNNYFRFAPDDLRRMQDLAEFVGWLEGQDLTDRASTDQHLLLQCRLIDLSQIDYLGRLETFDADVAEICRRIGVAPVVSARRNASTAQPPRLDPDVVARIRSLYRLDRQVFGY